MKLNEAGVCNLDMEKNKLPDHEQRDIDIKGGNYNENVRGNYNENVEENHYEIQAETVNIFKKSNNKLFVWITLGLGTIIAGIFTIFLVPKPSLSEKYVSYENSDYKIKIERPQKWMIQEEDGPPYPGIIVISPQENNTDNFQEQVKFSVEQLDFPYSLNEYTDETIGEIEKSNSIIEKPKKITLANREGRKVIYQGKDGRKRLQVWAIKNQKAYIVTYTAEPDKFKKFSKQADTIIQSLEIKR